MANIVFPGSYTPPPEAPESVVNETPNPLLDTTNGSLRRRRATTTTAAAWDKEQQVRPRTLNLFQAHGALPYSDDVFLGNADGGPYWVMFYVDNDDALEELRHSHGVVAVRRGAEAHSWLIQFKSLLLAAKAEANRSNKGRLVQKSELEALTSSSLVLDRTVTSVPHHHDGSSFSSATNVPNIWLHSKEVVVAGSNNNNSDQLEVDSPPLPCWKVLLRYFLGLEDQPTRFVGVRH